MYIVYMWGKFINVFMFVFLYKLINKLIVVKGFNSLCVDSIYFCFSLLFDVISC